MASSTGSSTASNQAAPVSGLPPSLVRQGPWWTWVLRGALAILIGVTTFVLPQATLLALVYLFAAYAVVEGGLSGVAAIRTPVGGGRWWALVVGAVVSIVVGALAFAIPEVTTFALVLLVAAWAMVTGVLAVVAGIRLRKEIEGEWLLVLSGVLSILFSALLFLAPEIGALTIALYFGIYVLLFGVLLVVLGFRVRRWRAQAGSSLVH